MFAVARRQIVCAMLAGGAFTGPERLFYPGNEVFCAASATYEIPWDTYAGTFPVRELHASRLKRALNRFDRARLEEIARFKTSHCIR
jgi:hypothetical protein